MSSLRRTLKGVTPEPISQRLSTLYWRWHNRGRHQAAALVSARRRESVRKIRSYKDRYQGQRCFILGNGPSLRRTDLSLLKEEITFGANRVYLLFPELGFTTTFLTSVNSLVIEQCADEFKELSLPKFITWRARQWMANDPQTIFMDTDYTLPEDFTEDVSRRVYEGNTVTYVALQLAFHMGFEQVVLIGVDHHFTTTGPANEVVISEGDDPNHFSPDYFGKGFRWQLPDLEGSERAYKLARQAFEGSGRQVIDATIEGKLTVFPKVSYDSLFDA